MKKCQQCGAESPDTWTVCGSCGSALMGGEAAPAPPAEGQAAPSIEGQAEAPVKKGLPTWAWVLIACAVACSCLGVPILAAILFPVFSQAKLAARSQVAFNDANHVSLGVLLYVADFDDVFPPLHSGPQVAETVAPYLKTNYYKDVAAGYVWNEGLSEVAAPSVANPGQVWLFHSYGPDAARKFEIGEADGHAIRVTPDEFARIMAQPVDFSKVVHVGHDAPSK
ncbi:MAG: zinc ribbon domain-containing protein [Fimbriimonas ginsengisoli]|uniref:Zinc ribbon domain-containing protein n=1 Tax=Fimbriimonas ginsengisoli TaxID=1005039 RepID=A0A931LRH8_FIMGI|nr:zinc ribbon domain-containing protein [Fimbriimonas ginsengisoli]